LTSVSKPLTALTTLLWVDAGKLTLDECVNSMIPELSDCVRDINIRDLLTHTSGLQNYGVLGYLLGLHSEHPYSEDDIIGSCLATSLLI
jgi:CubicO group peptidase (beta-lactamase class C family)